MILHLALMQALTWGAESVHVRLRSSSASSVHLSSGHRSKRNSCGWEGRPSPPQLTRDIVNRRPAGVVNHIEKTCSRLKTAGHSELCPMYQRAYTNTLDFTVRVDGDQNTTFVTTGDIQDMWLRDSEGQVNHYLNLVEKFPDSAKDLMPTLVGLFKQHMRFYISHPYANAFREDGSIAEEKYEIDSVCYTLKLGYRLWKQSGDASVFQGKEFLRLIKTILKQWQMEQDHDAASDYSHAELTRHRSRPKIGLIWTAFRPSDDASILHYNIPGNMMASVSLGMALEVLRTVYHSESELASRVEAMRDGIDRGIDTYGRAARKSGEIYAYEVDGYGNQTFMDDANVPSLLSIPYMNYSSPYHNTTSIYSHTRSFVLSKENPYYFSSQVARGIGSPHTGRGCIWHLGIIMEGLTASSQEERLDKLRMIQATTGHTGMLHESFDKDRPEIFTRGWFGWASSLFCELVEQTLHS